MQTGTLAGAGRWLTIAILSAGLAPAAIITGVSGPLTGSGTVSGSVSGTNITLTESITSFSVNDGFTVLLTQVSPPGATSYNVTKTVTNNTGATWTNFYVGIGCDANPFSPAPPRGSVDCYSSGLSDRIGNGALSSSAGTASGTTPGAFFTVGGINIAPGQTFTMNFTIDTCPNCTGGAVLWQYANVSQAPEPSTTAMIGGALIALPAVRRLRRRA